MNSTVRWLQWPGVVVDELVNDSSCENGGFVAPEKSRKSVFELSFDAAGPIFYEAHQFNETYHQGHENDPVEGCLLGYSANLTVSDSLCFDGVLDGNETSTGKGKHVVIWRAPCV